MQIQTFLIEKFGLYKIIVKIRVLPYILKGGTKFTANFEYFHYKEM